MSDSNTTRERTRANVFGACSHVLEFVQETYLCDRGSWPHLLCRYVSFEAAEVVSQTAESVEITEAAVQKSTESELPFLKGIDMNSKEAMAAIAECESATAAGQTAVTKAHVGKIFCCSIMSNISRLPLVFQWLNFRNKCWNRKECRCHLEASWLIGAAVRSQVAVFFNLLSTVTFLPSLCIA